MKFSQLLPSKVNGILVNSAASEYTFDYVVIA